MGPVPPASISAGVAVAVCVSAVSSKPTPVSVAVAPRAGLHRGQEVRGVRSVGVDRSRHPGDGDVRALGVRRSLPVGDRDPAGREQPRPRPEECYRQGNSRSVRRRGVGSYHRPSAYGFDVNSHGILPSDGNVDRGRDRYPVHQMETTGAGEHPQRYNSPLVYLATQRLWKL